MSAQLQVTGEAKIRDIQGPVVANNGVITALDGAANQYVRGDGTLAQFPTSGGGGSSVSYYLNGSVSQGNIGGQVYYQMSKNAITGVGTNFSTSTNGLLAQFITDANDPDVVQIPSGNWNVEFFMNVSASSGSLASFYVEFYKWNGSNFTLIASNIGTPEQLTNTTTVDAYFTSVAMPTTALAITDRIAIKIFANVASKTVTLYTEDNRLSEVITTFSKGLTSLNNLTDQSQYLTVGTSGSDFNIASSGDTHTFNIPNAGSGTRGLITSVSQTIDGAKSFSSLLTTNAVNVNGVLTLNSTLSNGTFFYTLPFASGVLALTSQIPSISGTVYQVTRYNSSGTGLEGGSISDYGTTVGTPPNGFVIMNSRLTVNNYAEINRYISIIQNPDDSWTPPTSGTNLELFFNSVGGISGYRPDSAYIRPRKASDDTYKTLIIQGDSLILNDNTTRKTLINKQSATQSTTKVEIAGYTRFDNSINVNGVLQFNATDSVLPTYLQAPSGNVTLMTTGQITLGTNSVNKFVFDVNGALNLGTSDNSNIININNQFSTLNGTMQGVHITPSIVSATPVIYTGVRSYPQFFLSTDGNFAQVTHFAALNASNTRDTASQVGLYIENLSSIGLAYGIQSLINSGTNRYNLYLSGTANNYIKGNLGIDQTNPLYAIDVTGDVNVTGNFKINGTNLVQGISGSGTQHYIPKFTSASSVGNSSIYQAPSTGHLLINTTYDYFADGGYLQVAGGFTTDSFANIVYGSSPFAGNTVTFRLVNGNTIQGANDKTYYIENKINAGATSANYSLSYWDSGSIYTRYTLDNTGLHAFNGDMTLSGSLLSPLRVTTNDNNFAFNVELKNTNNGTQALTGLGISNSSGTRKGQLLWIPSNYVTASLQNSFLVSSVTNIPLILCADATGASTPNIKFQSGASDRMTLFGTSGNLAIGYSSDNGARLQVAGAANFASSVTAGDLISTSYGSARIQVTSTTNGVNSAFRLGAKDSTGTAKNAGLYYVAGTTTATTFLSLVADDNNYQFNVLANGNVGIGTSSPSSFYGFARTLSVENASNAEIQLKATGGTNLVASFGTADGGTYLQSATQPLITVVNGAERMRITSGGNVGIGTSTFPAFTSSQQMTMKGGASNANSIFQVQSYDAGTSISIYSGAGASDDPAIIFQKNLRFGSATDTALGGYSERMRITSSGNVGIGTSAPTSISGYTILSINNATYGGLIDFLNNNTLQGRIGADQAGMYVQAKANIPMILATNDTERMRITSGGNVLIGSTTDNGYALQINGSGTTPLYTRNTGASSGNFWKVGPDSSNNYLVYNQSNAGVYLANGATSWTANSDERLKNINCVIDSALSKLMTLRAVNFSWKSDNSKTEVLGLIAQDVEKVFPQVIDKNKLPFKLEEKQTDETEYLGVRYTELIPVLIAAIQEQQAQIEELKQLIKNK